MSSKNPIRFLRLCAYVVIMMCASAIIALAATLHRWGQEAATLSLLWGVYDTAASSTAQPHVTEEWRVLADNETERLLQGVASPQEWRRGEPVVDKWGARIRVAARNRGDGTEYVAWSIGRDGIAFTNDDMFISERTEGIQEGSPEFLRKAR